MKSLSSLIANVPPREWRRPFLLGVGIGVVVTLVATLHPARLAENFFAAKSELRALGPWMRQAVDATYDDCRGEPRRCLNRVVVWPVSHRAVGSFYSGDTRKPIQWRNRPFVPETRRQGRFPAVAIVNGVSPEGIELTFLGSPNPAFSRRPAPEDDFFQSRGQFSASSVVQE